MFRVQGFGQEGMQCRNFLRQQDGKEFRPEGSPRWPAWGVRFCGLTLGFRV